MYAVDGSDGYAHSYAMGGDAEYYVVLPDYDTVETAKSKIREIMDQR